MEKPVAELIQEQGIEMAIPDGAQWQQLEAIVDETKDMNIETVVGKLDQSFEQNYGAHMSDDSRNDVFRAIEHVKEWARNISVNPSSQTGILHYQSAVKRLERMLERAKTHAMEHHQRERSMTAHSMAGTRPGKGILDSLTGRHKSDFEEWVKNRPKGSVPSFIGNLKSYADRRGVSKEEQNRLFDYDFLQRFFMLHGHTQGVPYKRHFLINARNLITGYRKQNQKDYDTWRDTVERHHGRAKPQPTQRPDYPDPSKQIPTYKPIQPKTPTYIAAQSMTNLFSDPLATIDYGIKPPPPHQTLRLRGAGGPTSSEERSDPYRTPAQSQERSLSRAGETPPMTRRPGTPLDEGARSQQRSSSRGRKKSANTVQFAEWFPSFATGSRGKKLPIGSIVKAFRDHLATTGRAYEMKTPIEQFIVNQIQKVSGSDVEWINSRGIKAPSAKRAIFDFKGAKPDPARQKPDPAEVRRRVAEARRQLQQKTPHPPAPPRFEVTGRTPILIPPELPQPPKQPVSKGFVRAPEPVPPKKPSPSESVDTQDYTGVEEATGEKRDEPAVTEEFAAKEQQREGARRSPRQRSLSRLTEDEVDAPPHTGLTGDLLTQQYAEAAVAQARRELSKTVRPPHIWKKSPLTGRGASQPPPYLIRDDWQRSKSLPIDFHDRMGGLNLDPIFPRRDPEDTAKRRRSMSRDIDAAKQIASESFADIAPDTPLPPSRRESFQDIIPEVQRMQEAEVEDEKAPPMTGVADMSPPDPAAMARRDLIDTTDTPEVPITSDKTIHSAISDRPLPTPTTQFIRGQVVDVGTVVYNRVTGNPESFRSRITGTLVRVPQTPAQLDEMLEQGVLTRDTPEYQLFREIIEAKAHALGSPEEDVWQGLMGRTRARSVGSSPPGKLEYAETTSSRGAQEEFDKVNLNIERLENVLEQERASGNTDNVAELSRLLRQANEERNTLTRSLMSPTPGYEELPLPQGLTRGRDLDDQKEAPDPRVARSSADATPMMTRRNIVPPTPPPGFAAQMIQRADRLRLVGGPPPIPQVRAPVRGGRRLRPRGQGARRRGIARVVAGVQGAQAQAVQNFPLGPGLQRNVQLRRAQFQPQHYDPDVHRNIVYADLGEQDLGREFYAFRRRNAEQDPMTTLTCSRYAKRKEIGDHIQMCIEPNAIQIVVYTKASLKALEVLVRKLKYHTKKMPKATLSEHGVGILYDNVQLQKGTVRKIAETLQLLLRKRRSMLRLVLNGSTPGGPMSKEWMHTAAAMRVI